MYFYILDVYNVIITVGRKDPEFIKNDKEQLYFNPETTPCFVKKKIDSAGAFVCLCFGNDFRYVVKNSDLPSSLQL